MRGRTDLSEQQKKWKVTPSDHGIEITNQASTHHKCHTCCTVDVYLDVLCEGLSPQQMSKPNKHMMGKCQTNQHVTEETEVEAE
jgi:hypothetical protein